MSGFVSSVTLSGGRQTPISVATCRRVAPRSPVTTPFFASAAFGSPVPAQIRPPLPVAPITPYFPVIPIVPISPCAPVAPFAPPRMEVTIIVGENEPVESALRRFKKDVAKSGHLFELRRRRYFETNTERRLRKAAASRRKAKIAKAINRNKAK